GRSKDLLGDRADELEAWCRRCGPLRAWRSTGRRRRRRRLADGHRQMVLQIVQDEVQIEALLPEHIDAAVARSRQIVVVAPLDEERRRRRGTRAGATSAAVL